MGRRVLPHPTSPGFAVLGMFLWCANNMPQNRIATTGFYGPKYDGLGLGPLGFRVCWAGVTSSVWPAAWVADGGE